MNLTRRKRAGLRFALLLAAASCASAAGAQRSFSLLANTGVDRDENFFRRASQVEEKTLGSVGLTAKYGYEKPTLDFELLFVPSFRRELDQPGYENDSQRLHLRLDKQFSERTSMGLRGKLLATDNTQLGPEEPLLVQQRTETRSGGINLDLEHALDTRSSLLVGAEYSRSEYESAALFDHRTLGVVLGVGRELSRRDELKLLARARRFDLSNDNDTDVTSLGLAYERVLAPSREVTVEAGAFRIEGRGRVIGAGFDDDSDELGWYGGLYYRHASAEPFSYTARLWREVSPSIGFGDPTVVESATVTAATPAGDKLSFDFIAGYARYLFLFGRDQQVEALQGTARANWFITPDIRLSFDYTRVHQTADLPDLDNLDYGRYSAGINFPLFRSGPRDQAAAP